jgi:hypothetical protein
MNHTLSGVRSRMRSAAERRQRVRRLREELQSYRTPAERAEIEAILARHHTTLSDMLRRAA